MKIYQLKCRKKLTRTSLLLATLAVSTIAAIADLVPGSLVVERVGDGSAALSSAGTPVFLDLFNTDGTSAGITIPLPRASTRPASAPFNLVDSGSATSQGHLTRSTDGTVVQIPGYNGTVGEVGIAASASSLDSRTVGVLSVGGTVDTSRSYSMLSGNNYRSVVSMDGTAFWAAGAPGIVYVNNVGTVTSLSTVNSRLINIFNGQLYYSTGSGSIGIYALGSGVPTSGSPTGAQIISVGGSSPSPYGFSINPQSNVAYVADDRGNAQGGIIKYTFNGSAWSSNYTIGTGAASVGARGLVVDWSGANPIIFATSAEGSANRLIKIIDTGAASTASTLATAAANTAFRGVTFAPQVACTSPTAFNVIGGNGCTDAGVTIGLDNSQSGVNYQLFKGASAVGAFVAGTGSVISFGNQTAAGTYSVIATNTTGNCTATMSGSVTITSIVTPAVTVAQDPPGSVCSSSTVIFTATPVNGGASPSYVWKTSGVVVSGVTGSTFTNTTPVDAETIDCQLISSAICASPATADATQIVLSVGSSTTPSISISAAPGSTICAGTPVTFTATPVNGGPTPHYQWQKNGVNVGADSSTYSDSGLANADSVLAVLTSTDPCRSTDNATSAPIVMTVNALLTPSVSIAANPGSTVCSNTPVNFTATPVNGGSAPTYQWRTNGTPVPGATSVTFLTSSLQNGDVVTVVMTPSGDICVTTPTATSSGITMIVNPNLTPSVTVAANPPSPICLGTPVTFSATPVNGGATPSFQWKKNGNNVGTDSSTYQDNALVNGDSITVVLTPSSEICVTSPTATSSAVKMTVNTFLIANTVLSENFGNPSATTVVNSYTGFQNGPPVTFSSSSSPQSDVRTTSPSTGYPGASGQGNLFMGTATSNNRDVTISGIDTTARAGLALQFGLRQESSLSGALTLEVSSDGTTWTPLSFTAPASLNTWILTTTTGTIPGTSNLQIRFSKNNSSQFRIDDFKVLSDVTTAAAITVGGSTNICAGSTVTLTASAGGTSYLWSDGETTSSIVVSNSGTYTVTITDANGCSSSASQEITVTPLPTVSVNSETICAGGSAILTATTSASNPAYLWSPGGATTPSITVSPASTTTYTVLVTDGTTTCANSGSGTVTVNPLPTVSVNSETICAGGSAILTATTSASNPSYLWSPGGATTPAITVSPASTATYTVLVTDGTTTCANSASGTVTVNPLPAVTVNSTTICAGDSTTLTATTSASNPTYLWGPGGETTPSITVSPVSTTNYTVTVTDGTTTCANSASGTVTVNSVTASNAPFSEINGLPFHIEEADLLSHATGTGGVTLASVQSPSTNGVTITRSGGRIFYNAALAADDSFTYTVTSTTGSCIATGNVFISAVTIPAPQISVPSNGTVVIKFFGIPDDSYVVQSAGELVGPWSSRDTNTAGTDGSWIYTDSFATNQFQFYRSVQP